MPNPRYKTIQDYMERTGTNQQRLLEKVYKATGTRISPQMFSMILSGSRRCSKWNAWALHDVTGVPVSELTRWPRYSENENSRSVA